MVGEAKTTVKLKIMAEPLVDAGHADQDEGEVCAVVAVTEHLERHWGEPFGFVDDEEFYVHGAAPDVGSVNLAGRQLVFPDADVDSAVPVIDIPHHLFGPG